jgi:hypothetical protein
VRGQNAMHQQDRGSHAIKINRVILHVGLWHRALLVISTMHAGGSFDHLFG